MLSIRLPDDIETRLETLATQTGRTKSYYVKEALMSYLDDLEDFYLAEQRMQRFDDSQAIPLAELVEKYGVAD